MGVRFGIDLAGSYTDAVLGLWVEVECAKVADIHFFFGDLGSGTDGEEPVLFGVLASCTLGGVVPHLAARSPL